MHTCALQFFALADIFLSSPLVPAYTMAAFAKRLARLSLTAPPAGAMIAIAFIHNLMRCVGWRPEVQGVVRQPGAMGSRWPRGLVAPAV